MASTSTSFRSSATSPSLRSPSRTCAASSFLFSTGATARATLLRQNIEYVLRYAVVEKHRPDNPAADLKWLLPNVRKVPNHRASLPYRQAPEAMAEWQALSINPAVKLAILFIVFTAARLSEATEATLVGDRPGRAHLDGSGPSHEGAPRPRGPSLAAGPRGAPAGQKATAQRLAHLRDSRFQGRGAAAESAHGFDALRRLGRVDEDGRPITVHGFRSTFRVWAMECVPGSSEAAEVALAHEESDRTKKIFRRRDTPSQTLFVNRCLSVT